MYVRGRACILCAVDACSQRLRGLGRPRALQFFSPSCCNGIDADLRQYTHVYTAHNLR
jgi:hypothetical protein